MLQETVVLLYFGFSFLWLEVEVRGGVTGNILFMKELDAGKEAQDTFTKAVLKDLKLLNRANFTTKKDACWTGTRFFKRVERSKLWVYQHATNVNCFPQHMRISNAVSRSKRNPLLLHVAVNTRSIMP